MDYSINEVIEQIISNSRKRLGKKILNQFKSLKSKDKKKILKHRSELIYKVLYLDLDMRTGEDISASEIKKIVGRKLNDSEMLELAKGLKSYMFQYDSLSPNGYTCDFFNCFNEVTYYKGTGNLTLYLSDKILLKGES